MIKTSTILLLLLNFVTIQEILEQKQIIKEICKDMGTLKIEQNIEEFTYYLTPCDKYYLNKEEKQND